MNWMSSGLNSSAENRCTGVFVLRKKEGTERVSTCGLLTTLLQCLHSFVNGSMHNVEGDILVAGVRVFEPFVVG